MVRKINRPLILIVLCSTVGIALGGVSSWVEGARCLQAEVPTTQCVTQDMPTALIGGMGSGLIAGLGAAIGATWQLKREEE